MARWLGCGIVVVGVCVVLVVSWSSRVPSRLPHHHDARQPQDSHTSPPLGTARDAWIARGRVTDEMGTPLSRAKVFTVSPDGFRLLATSETDEAGHWSLEVSEGAGTLGATKPGWIPDHVRIRRGDLQPARIVLRRIPVRTVCVLGDSGGSCEVRIERSDGSAIEDYPNPGERQYEAVFSVPIGACREFIFPSAGPLSGRVHAPNLAAEPFSMKLGDTTATVRLRASAVLTLHIKDRVTHAPAAALVDVVRSDGTVVAVAEGVEGTTTISTGLAPGRYRVRARASQFEETEASLVIREHGEAAPLTLLLPPRSSLASAYLTAPTTPDGNSELWTVIIKHAETKAHAEEHLVGTSPEGILRFGLRQGQSASILAVHPRSQIGVLARAVNVHEGMRLKSVFHKAQKVDVLERIPQGSKILWCEATHDHFGAVPLFRVSDGPSALLVSPVSALVRGTAAAWGPFLEDTSLAVVVSHRGRRIRVAIDL